MKPNARQIANALNEILVPEPVNKQLFINNGTKGKYEFLFFVKPEVTLPCKQIDFCGVLNLIFDKIGLYRLDIAGIRLINAAYLQKHNIIARHYGVINKLSSNLASSISEDAVARFEEVYHVKFSSSEVYGSLEFLKAFPHFTPTGLAYLWQNSAWEKLAGGTYSQKLMLDGKPVYLINGFHPRQLEHFLQPDRSIVVINLAGDVSWEVARNSFVGKTNPFEAEKGSIRNELLLRKNEFGLETVSASWNGVHLSAGPVEALVELIRYNSQFENDEKVSPKAFNFGKKLTDVFGEEKMNWVLSNPTVEFRGAHASIFDLTEEMDSNECVEFLKTLSL